MTKKEVKDASAGALGAKGESHFDAIAAAAELVEAMGQVPGQEESSAPGSGGGDYVEMLEREIETVNNLLAQKDAQLAKASAKVDEVLGDIERSKDRIERQADRELEARTRKLLSAFLEVLDDLDRAIEAARNMDHNPDVVKGVELVRKRFMTMLQGFKVTQQDAKEGGMFDPTLHDAVGAVPAAEGVANGTIIGVTRAGYMIGDEVLRPAGVVVAKG